MTFRTVRTIPFVFAALLFAGGAAEAQLFGQPRNEESDAVARMSRLENQIRQLTGMIEELQHRQVQLESQVKRSQQDNEFRFQEMNPSGRAPAARGQRGSNDQPPSLPPQASRELPPQPPRDLPPQASRDLPPQPQRGLPQSQTADLGPPTVPGRRGDAFDPTVAPDAPGVPRTLGSVPGGGIPAEPTRRGAGSPLDLGSLANTPGGSPAPGSMGDRGLPPAGAPAGQQQAVLAPSDSPRDEYDLAFGAVQRRDYPLAVQGFRTFLANHSGSRAPDAQRLVPEANFWLGESQFQLKQYNDAAETFLKISTEYPNAVKAPDALLRLGQSLAALGERETACASLGHVLTKYPKASGEVKRTVEQEQKRVRC